MICVFTLIISGALWRSFLPFNFSSARVFAGDTGAIVSGLYLAAISIEGTQIPATMLTLFAPVLALGIPYS